MELAVALLLARLGSVVVLLIVAVTTEVPEAGCVYLTLIGPTLMPDASEVGIPVKVITPVAGA